MLSEQAIPSLHKYVERLVAKSTESSRVLPAFCKFYPWLRRAMECRAGSKILHSKKLANLDLGFFSSAVGGGDTLGPLDRFFLRFHLDDPVPSDQLLGLGKGPVEHHMFSSRKLDARSLRAG